MVLTYTQLTLKMVFYNRRLFFATILLFILPFVAIGISLTPFYLLGILIGGTDLWLFTGMFVAIPAVCIGFSIGLIPVVKETNNLISDSNEEYNDLTDDIRLLSIWGCVFGMFSPIVRLTFIKGNPGVTALNDIGYIGRRAIFYGPQTILITDNDFSSFQEMYEESSTTYQQFHGGNKPVTGLATKLRRIGTVIISITAVISVFVSASLGVTLLVITCSGYLLIKHIAHTLLYVYNSNGTPNSKDPRSQFDSKLYEAVLMRLR